MCFEIVILFGDRKKLLCIMFLLSRSCNLSTFVCRHHFNKSFCRLLLSSAYECREVWDRRFDDPLLQKVDRSTLFQEINQRFMRKKKVYATDIDFFVNVANETQIDEIDILLFKFRRTRRTKDMLESTQHATIRLFIQSDAGNHLLKILNKRTQYGLFPDHFCYNMLMDYFIKKNDFRGAARTASLMMLQEDFNNEVGRILALYSVHMYLQDENRANWFDEDELPKEEEVKEEDEEEIQYVRVPFLLNPYDDDHFDLRNPMFICGKTLYHVGKEFDDIVGRSVQIFGLALYNKWSKALSVLDKFEKNSKVVLSETIDKVNEVIDSLSEETEEKEEATKLVEKLNSLKSSDKLEDGNLQTLISEKLNLIHGLEATDIKSMTQIILQFPSERERSLNAQLLRLAQQQKRGEIEEKKKELVEKEKLLYFFENANQIEMDFEAAEKKIAEIMSQTQVEEEEYIPPSRHQKPADIPEHTFKRV